MRIFQPEPLLNYYSKGLPNRDRSYLGPLGARVHATSSNFLADYLALNSVQFTMLQHEISGTDNEFCLTYILPTRLPIPGTEPDEARITLPTVTLPNNAHYIWSPVPYAVFTHYEYPGPFLPHSAVHPGPLIPSPLHAPPPPALTPSNETLSPLALLVQACGLSRQLTHLQDEETAEAWDTFLHKMSLERELEAILRSIPTMLSPHSPLSPPSPSAKRCKDNRTAGRTKGVRHTCPGPSKGRGEARYFAPKGTQGKEGVGRKSKAEG